MSDTLYFNNKITLTQFYNGNEICIQITSNDGKSYIQLNKTEALSLVSAILDWVVDI